MKAKMFAVVLPKLKSGKSPATVPEESLNEFLTQQPDLRLVTSHMSTWQRRPAEFHARKGGIIHHHLLPSVDYTDLGRSDIAL